MPEEKNSKDQNVIEPSVTTEKPSMPVPPMTDMASSKEPVHKVRLLSIALLIMVSASAGFGGGWLSNRDNSKGQSIQQQQVILKSQGELISSIAKDAGASVVSIEVTSQARPTSSFFGYQGTTEEQSAGTGFILSKDGIIITNRHVIPTGTTKVNVVLSDGTTYEDVKVIGRASDSDPLDVAFLKIEDTKGKQLSVARLGDSSKTSIGESVVAIGNALGQFQNTVTSGIISGHGRSIEAGDESGSSENLQNLFQTDAAINPGNSGGPLVNLNGEVIGINTAVAAGGAQNIGFSIPINDVKGMIASVQQKGKLERPYIGLVYVPITADLAKRYNLSVEEGAYVPPAVSIGRDTVIDGGPADKAGIKEGDIITKIAGQKLDNKHSLTSLLGKYEVGKTVEITIVRDGKERVVSVTLAALVQ